MIAVRLIGLLAGAAAFLAALPARAQGAVELEFQAEAGCPGESHFVAAVADRGGRFTGAEAEARARTLSVAVVKVAGRYVGTLRVTAPDGTTSAREVNDPSCVEVVNGLAVVTAIALGASQTEPATSEPVDAGTAPEQPQPEPRPEPAPEPKSEPGLRGTSFGNPATLDVKAGKLRFENDRRYALSAGADVGLVPGLVLPRLDLSASVASFVSTPETSRLVGPIVQVRWTWLGPATRRDGDLETRAFALGASVSSCSAFPYDTRGLSLLACGEFGVGVLALATESDDGAFKREREVGFGTAALNVEAQYSFSEHLHAGFRLGGRLQTGDLSAQGPAGEKLFEAGLFGAYASLGFGVHF